MLIMFITLGKYLEAIAKGRTSDAIRKLISLQAKTARVLREGKELEIPAEDVLVGDIVIIKPGEKVPVDGVVIEGHSAVDESMISGESIPVEKKVGDECIGATLNKNGLLRIRATKVGKDTALAQIVKLVEDAQTSKPPVQRLADVVAGQFALTVLIYDSDSMSLRDRAGNPDGSHGRHRSRCRERSAHKGWGGPGERPQA
jgi:Cu+-exporting ATPase